MRNRVDITGQERLSIPGAGRTVSAATEKRAEYVRSAVHLIGQSLDTVEVNDKFLELFGPRWDCGITISLPEPTAVRAAWTLVNIWILARLSGHIVDGGSFEAAENWFYGRHASSKPSLAGMLSPSSASKSVDLLSQLTYDQDFSELLPYILEPHGPGSRLSVRRDPSTRIARDAKRKAGVFYTPADVAEFMASAVLAHSGDVRCFDPACGNGVFLLALIRTAEQNEREFSRLDFAVRSLYGADISPLAVEACTFTMLHACLAEVEERRTPPWCAWHAIRMNLAATDSLRLLSPTAALRDDGSEQNRQVIRSSLLAGDNVSQTAADKPRPSGNVMGQWFSMDAKFHAISAVFPEVPEGFDVLVGNPPYAALGERDDFDILSMEYASCSGPRITATANGFPLFIEMMWRLTRRGQSLSALVVPLSIAFHGGGQYSACRRAMSSHGGLWRCAFFDREPHALFGEDVKTRNAILIRSESDVDPDRNRPANLQTGPLLKWTSRTRHTLFSSLTYTDVKNVDFTEGLPKVSGARQARAFAKVMKRTDRLKTLWSRGTTCVQADAAVRSDVPRVFVGSTAYNFLSVFRTLSLDAENGHPLSENKVHCYEFATEENAAMAFAVLSSRLAFWLWHVTGDGFHVGRRFIENLPFERKSFTVDQAAELEKCGRDLWGSLQAHRIVSLNRGRKTVAFRPLACEAERNAIDSLLIRAADLPKAFCDTLKEFVKNVVLIDETDSRRKSLHSYFEPSEIPQ